MDVVRTSLDKLKGTVHVSSQQGKGTTIQLRVPLTLASIQTLLFLLPVASLLFHFPRLSKSRASPTPTSIVWTSAKFYAFASNPYTSSSGQPEPNSRSKARRTQKRKSAISLS